MSNLISIYRLSLLTWYEAKFLETGMYIRNGHRKGVFFYAVFYGQE